MILDVNQVCFEEEMDIPNRPEKLRKIQRVTGWCKCRKWEGMHINVECLNYDEIEALGYFQLWDMRYNDINMATKWVNRTVLKNF